MNSRRWMIIICILYTMTLLCCVKPIRAESQENSNQLKTTTGDSPGKSAKPSVRCDRDVIIISVPKEFVRSPASGKIVSPKYIMFRTDASDHCRAQEWDQESYRISINTKSNFLCGLRETRNDYQIIYENEVVWLDAEAGRIWSLINVTCHYNDEDHIVFLPASSREAKMKTSKGDTLNVKMNIFREKSFSDSAKFPLRIPPISVGHFLFVSVDVILPDSDDDRFRNVRIVSDTCYASYFPSSKDKTMIHTFITNGCADKIDSTVAIEGNGVGFSSRWKFQMFKWVNTTNQRVYLFCEMFLCEESRADNGLQCDMNKTKSNCYGQSRFSSRSRRQTSVTSARKELRGYVAVGPIFPKDSVYLLDIPKGSMHDQFNKGSGNDTDAAGTSHAIPIAVGVVFGIIVVILVVAGYLIRNSTRKNSQRKDKGQVKIEQGFAFVLKSSKDPKIFETKKTPTDREFKKTDSDKTSEEDDNDLENQRRRKNRKNKRSRSVRERNYDSEENEIRIEYGKSLNGKKVGKDLKVRRHKSTTSYHKEVGTSKEAEQECKRNASRAVLKSLTSLTVGRQPEEEENRTDSDVKYKGSERRSERAAIKLERKES